jgi:hypothetical protein
MTPEDRLRDALAARAADVEPGPDGLDKIESRLGGSGVGASVWRRGAPFLAVAALAAAVVAAVTLLPNDDGEEVATAPSRTDGGPSTTVGTSATTVPMPCCGDVEAVWPIDGERITDPDDVVLGFAHDFLHMPGAQIVERNASAGAYVIQPFDTGGPKTTVLVAGYEGQYFVTGARADDIQLTSPRTRDAVLSPVRVRGTGTAFEATLNYHVYESGRMNDIAGGDHIVMAGSNGEMAPFDDTIPFSRPTTDAIVLVLYEGDASGQGEISAATVVRLLVEGISPIGGNILAWTDHAELITIGLDGSNREVVYQSASPGAPHIARSSFGISFVSDRDFSDASTCGRTIYRAIAGREREPVVAGDWPVVRPDEGALAYSGCDGNLHVRDLNSGTDRVIDAGVCTQAWPLSWSSNSKQLVVGCTRDDASAIWIVPATASAVSGNPVYSIANPGRLVNAQWLADDKRILVAFDNTAETNGGAGFEIVDPSNGEKPVQPAGDVAKGIRSFAVNSQNEIAYVDGDGVLWIRTLAGSTQEVGEGYEVVDW